VNTDCADAACATNSETTEKTSTATKRLRIRTSPRLSEWTISYLPFQTRDAPIELRATTRTCQTLNTPGELRLADRDRVTAGVIATP
jgi:hypothetical protein